MSDRQWHGTWWLPEDPDDPQPGVLHVEADGGARLELIGGIDLTIRTPLPGGGYAVGDSRVAPVIHGDAEGKAITLLNCFTTHARGGALFAGRPAFHRLHVNRVLVGVHLGDEAEAIFRSGHMQFENLTMWLQAGSIETSSNWTDGIAEARLTQQPSQQVAVGDWTLDITASTSPFKLEARRDRLTIRGDATAYLSLTPSATRTLAAFDQVVGDVGDLLTLASGVPCGLIEYTLRLVEDDVWSADGQEIRHARTVEVLGRRVHTADPDAPGQNVNKFRFTCHDLSFESVMTAWLPLAQRTRAACDVYFGAFYAPPTFTDTRVLFAAIAAESLHDSLNPDATAMPPEEFADLTQRLRAALPDAGDRARLKQLLHNRPTFRERLLELCNEPAPNALDLVVPDRARWAQDLTRSRNGLAHTGGAGPTIDLFKLSRSSMDLIALVLMARLGIDSAVQERAAQEMVN